MMKFENILPASIRKETFWIPKEMTITGSIRTDSSGQIAGIVHGDIQVSGKLIIAKEAIIIGNISATDIMVYGKVTGDIRCANKMIVQSGARIKGNIYTSEIHLEKDSLVDGIITKLSDPDADLEEEPVSFAKENEYIPPVIHSVAEKGDTEPQVWF